MGFTSFSGSENFSLGATAVTKMGIPFEIVNIAGICGGSKLVVLEQWFSIGEDLIMSGDIIDCHHMRGARCY